MFNNSAYLKIFKRNSGKKIEKKQHGKLIKYKKSTFKTHLANTVVKT